jgi:CubicO group peptidase (beta-lactamase class C family)
MARTDLVVLSINPGKGTTLLKPIPKLAAILAFSALSAGCMQGDTEDSPNVAKSAEDILREAVATYDVPGMGAVVASSNGVLDLQLVGIKKMDGKIPLESNDPFHIGSVTKTFTATIIAKLVEANMLEWETPVLDVLPDSMQSAHRAFKGITLSHLLSHEAGLQPMEEDAELEQVPELTGDIRSQRRQFARWILQQEPAGTPFAEYRYSNAHFIVAASMAETVSGRSWEELVEEHIFSVLDMRSAGFGWAGKQGESVPWGHTFRDGTLHPVDPNGDYQLPQYFAPAGDIYTSLPDMASYFQAYLTSWDGKGGFLEKDTLQNIWTRRINSGLGWGVSSAFGYELVATYSGSADTFLMIVILIPDADVGVAVVANAFNEDVEGAVVEVLRGIVKLYTPRTDENEITK